MIEITSRATGNTAPLPGSWDLPARLATGPEDPGRAPAVPDTMSHVQCHLAFSIIACRETRVYALGLGTLSRHVTCQPGLAPADLVVELSSLLLLAYCPGTFWEIELQRGSL